MTGLETLAASAALTLPLSVQFKATGIDEAAGTFIGHASVFGNVDLGRDIMASGSFTKTLAEHNGVLPLTSDHSWDLSSRVGYVEAQQDSKGLAVVGHPNLEAQHAREVYSHVKQAHGAGMAMGMSIGYRPVKATADDETGIRTIHEAELIEVTLTQFPMNKAAGVTAVKSLFAGWSPPDLLQLQDHIKALLDGAADPGTEPPPALDATAYAAAIRDGFADVFQKL